MISIELRSVSDAAFAAVLDLADPLVLTGLLYHCTTDESLNQLKIQPGPGYLAEIPTMSDPADIGKVRKKAFELLKSYRDGIKLAGGCD